MARRISRPVRNTSQAGSHNFYRKPDFPIGSRGGGLFRSAQQGNEGIIPDLFGQFEGLR